MSPFFYQMLSRWLVPGKEMSVSLHFAIDYREFTICQIALSFPCKQDLFRAVHHFGFLKRELALGVESSYHATKILERKGLNLDEKNALIQENLSKFVRRFPKQFDYDLFEEMQQFFVSSKGQFRAIRQTNALSRIIFTLYQFRKTVEKQVAEKPHGRHVCLKFKPTLLHTPFGLKEVLSIYGGLNFLKSHELFEQRHFLAALQHILPSIRSIPSSYFASEGEGEIQTFYLEVEGVQKGDMALLQTHLAKEIQSRIEQLVPPVFMPRNEEEVMRNIVRLSHQLRYLRDIPQMIISFDEQTDRELCFTIVLLRVVLPDSLPIKELLQDTCFADHLSIERVKSVGFVRRKYPKEAIVLRISMPVSSFLREDFSIDFLRARQEIVREMEKIFGDVRDFNGGMISKQSENFRSLQQALGEIASLHALLLQNFFHSLYPVVFSTTLDPNLLKILFEMLLEVMELSAQEPKLKTKKADDHLFAMMKIQDFALKQKVVAQIELLEISSLELCSVQMHIFDSFYVGFLYLNTKSENQKKFLEKLRSLTFVENPSYL